MRPLHAGRSSRQADPCMRVIMSESHLHHSDLIRQLLRYQADFLAYLMAIVHDLHAAEEIFQNAAVVVMQHVGDPDAMPVRDFRLWAKEIVRRQALHYLRARRRASRVAAVEPGLLAEIDRVFDEDVTNADQRQRELDALRACNTLLPEVQRRMVAMRYERRASFDDIGTAVGRSAAAVQRALSRTRKMLHDCVRAKLTRSSGVV